MASSQNLGKKSKAILEAIYEQGGEADTTEVVEYTDLSRGQIQYRVGADGKLEEEDLVESRLVEASGSGSGSIRVLSLTEYGQELVGRLYDEQGGPMLSEQVERLKVEFQDVEEAAYQAEGHLDAVEDRLEELEEKVEQLEGLQTELSKLSRRVSEMEGQPLEERISEKIGEMESLMEKQQAVESMNSDVRHTLKQAGLLAPERQQVEREDAEGDFERDAYGEGDLLQKLRQLHAQGQLDALLQQV